MKASEVVRTAIAIASIAIFTPAATTPPPQVIGQVDAIVTSCTQADRRSAEEYKDLERNATRNMSEKQLADARNSAEYKNSYAAMTAQFGKTPANKVVDACHTFLKNNKDSKDDKDSDDRK